MYNYPSQPMQADTYGTARFLVLMYACGEYVSGVLSSCISLGLCRLGLKSDSAVPTANTFLANNATTYILIEPPAVPGLSSSSVTAAGVAAAPAAVPLPAFVSASVKGRDGQPDRQVTMGEQRQVGYHSKSL
jgi:hypothetical protein